MCWLAYVTIYLSITAVVGIFVNLKIWTDGSTNPNITPVYIYNHTKMNWFGCNVLYIVYIITCFPVWLVTSIYDLFHLGRHD